MLFNSYIFIFLFFPLVLLGYFGLNKLKKYNLAKVYLVIASLCFYGYFNYWYLLIIVCSVILNYIFSCIMLDSKTAIIRKIIFIISLIVNIGSLFFFKYYDFFISNINNVVGTSFTLLKMMLPLGISFFTFQQLSYVIDSYKGDVPKYNFLDYALFVTYFPQLIAGPIVTHDEMVPQFADESRKSFNTDNFAKGLYCFALGMAKKVIVADTFGLVVNKGFGDISVLSSSTALLVMLSYTMQIYFDFSGYCDMATGIGKMMNLEITANFNSPYKATSIVEFWKRWHITLTRFFTRYIYFPLGGNRNGKFKTYRNVFIVFLISGIWHGANWTFIIWGILHGIASIITRIIDSHTKWFSEKNKGVIKVINHCLTFAFLNLTWVIFRADSISQTIGFYKALFSGNITSVSEYMSLVVTDGWIIICYYIPIIGDYILKFTPYLFIGFALVASVFMKNAIEKMKSFKPNFFYSFESAVLLFWSIMSLAGVSTFLYWNF